MRRLLANRLCNLNRTCMIRDLSSDSYYVNKTRTLEWWKNDDSAILAEMKRSQNLLFLNHRPLLFKSKEHDGHYVSWIPYKKLKEALYKYEITLDHSQTALIDAVPMQSSTNDVYEEWLPVVAVGLKVKETNENRNIEEDLEKLLGGQFLDLRYAVFSLNTEHAQHLSKSQTLLRWSNTFKHCPKCGTALKVKVSKALASCDHCAKQYYPPVTPVALVLISDQENMNCLLVRQPRHIDGVYTAVAGFSEPGETLEETVRREVAEEVGIDVSNVRYATRSQPWPFPVSSLMCAFIATGDKRQHPDVDYSELEDARWFSREQVSQALNRTLDDPFLKKAGESKDFCHIPPAGTLSHQLIKNWLEDTR